jgi:5-methylcytosine-specific restriction enzyme A
VTDPDIICSLCGRRVPAYMITQHHLVPRERGGKPEHRIPLCRPCHKQVHALFENKHLERQYSDLAQFRRAPELQKFVRWICKQPATVNVTTRMANTHPKRRRN